MKVYTLNKEQKVQKNILDVFDFFSKPENLAILTPKRMGFTILTPSPIEMKEGTLIDYTVKIMCIPIRWRTLITKYAPPNIFIDQQLKGPYSMWHHTHTFEKINDKETLIKDTITYGVPFGFIGNIVNFLYIKKDLEFIFSYRKQKIEEIFSN